MVGSAKPVRAYLGLGANLCSDAGDREAALRRAIEMLDAREGIDLVRASSFVETEADVSLYEGTEPQPDYLNAAAAVDTTLAPRELLRACGDIERALGRVRGPGEIRSAPRTMDVDILLYGDAVVREPDLDIPHPRMHARDFVLGPLAEIAPRARHPVLDRTASEMLVALREASPVGGS